MSYQPCGTDFHMRKRFRVRRFVLALGLVRKNNTVLVLYRSRSYFISISVLFVVYSQKDLSSHLQVIDFQSCHRKLWCVYHSNSRLAIILLLYSTDICLKIGLPILKNSRSLGFPETFFVQNENKNENGTCLQHTTFCAHPLPLLA